jgi:pSer/pThr/pTyr-binding forkhead associated (FHA) protein
MPQDNLQLPNAFFIINSSKIFPIQQPKIKIGRESTNDFVIDDIHISRKHAELFYRQGFFWIRDLNSTSGTQVNGEKVKEQVNLQTRLLGSEPTVPVSDQSKQNQKA